jgi:hypothetical protein
MAPTSTYNCEGTGGCQCCPLYGPGCPFFNSSYTYVTSTQNEEHAYLLSLAELHRIQREKEQYLIHKERMVDRLVCDIIESQIPHYVLDVHQRRIPKKGRYFRLI